MASYGHTDFPPSHLLPTARLCHRRIRAGWSSPTNPLHLRSHSDPEWFRLRTELEDFNRRLHKLQFRRSQTCSGQNNAGPTTVFDQGPPPRYTTASSSLLCSARPCLPLKVIIMRQKYYTCGGNLCPNNPCDCDELFAEPESILDTAVPDSPSTPPDAPPTPPDTPPKGLSEHEPSMQAISSEGSGQSFDLPHNVSSCMEKAFPQLLPKPQRPISAAEPRQDSQPGRAFSEATVSSKIQLLKCKHCGRQFTGKSARQNLWRHYHWKVCTEGGNPVDCEVCDTQFGRNDALKRHRKSKTHKDREAELASQHALGSEA